MNSILNTVHSMGRNPVVKNVLSTRSVEVNTVHITVHKYIHKSVLSILSKLSKLWPVSDAALTPVNMSRH